MNDQMVKKEHENAEKLEWQMPALVALDSDMTEGKFYTLPDEIGGLYGPS